MHISTTPAGRRPMSRAMVIAQTKAIPNTNKTSLDKWEAYEVIKRCRTKLGLSNRAVAVLSALISFIQTKQLTAGQSHIVWPSNKSLAARCHDISEATLRRALSELVDAQVIVRRDSPNGKRYARRGEGGQLQRAFGFDLTPVHTRYDEFRKLANIIVAEERKLASKKEEFSIIKREIVKLIEFGLASEIKGNWDDLKNRYSELLRDFSRKVSLATVEAAINSLQPILAEITKSLNSLHNVETLSGNGIQNERHIESQNSESFNNSKNEFKKVKKEKLYSPPVDIPSLDFIDRNSTEFKTILGVQTITSWHQLIKLADQAVAAIGIGPTQWNEIIRHYSANGAAAIIAMVYEKLDRIQMPFAYLRKLIQSRSSAGSVVRHLYEH